MRCLFLASLLTGLISVSFADPLAQVAFLPAEPRLQTAPEHIACIGECVATLTITTDPADATVELPDLEEQYSPGLTVPEGPVRVAVRREGYVRTELHVEVVGNTRKTIRLEIAPTGTLTLALTPDDASVQLPRLRMQYEQGMVVPSGAVEVIVNREGYESVRRSINVVGHTKAKINLSPQKKGTLTLDLFPGDATVELSDIRAKYDRGMTLPAGPVRVRITRRGYMAVEATLVVDGPTREIIKLQRRNSGTLELDLFPPDAEVEILDASIAKKYQPGMTLPVGPIRIAVSRPGYLDHVSTIEIVDDVREIIELKPLPTVALTLVLSPEDALVELPDLDQKYWPGMPLTLGQHRVVVRQEGYEEFDQTIDLTADTSIDVTLVPTRKCLPVLNRSSRPNYPRAAVSEGIEGFVDVAFEIVKSGRVRNPVVADSSPPETFDNAAIDAIKKYRFNLPPEDCEAVKSVKKILRFTFEINEAK